MQKCFHSIFKLTIQHLLSSLYPPFSIMHNILVLSHFFLNERAKKVQQLLTKLAASSVLYSVQAIFCSHGTGLSRLQSSNHKLHGRTLPCKAGLLTMTSYDVHAIITLLLLMMPVLWNLKYDNLLNHHMYISLAFVFARGCMSPANILNET